MRVRIYQPTKTAMQSGMAKTRKWVVEPELQSARVPEPLMGWVSSGDTLTGLKMPPFDSKEAAIRFCEKNGYEYTVQEPKERRFKAKNYADNFMN